MSAPVPAGRTNIETDALIRRWAMSYDPKAQWRAILSQPVDIEPFEPLSSAVALEIGAASRCGKQRSHNTDHYLAIRIGRVQETLTTSLPGADLPPRFEESGYAMVVADGVGEDGSGAQASRVALSALAHLAIRYGKWNVRVDPDTSHEIGEQGEFFYRQANHAVFHASRADLGLLGMATSLTALYVAQDDLFFAHVGHSSAFLLRHGALIPLTTDRSLKHRRLGNGGASWSLQGTARELGRLVVHAIGARPMTPEVDIERIKLSPGDRLLLCTNGLTDTLTDEQIADALVPRRHPKQDCLRLINLAMAAGATDDVTVMVADYSLRRATHPRPVEGVAATS
jgi:serine/threonine protein phosphatase PrpC